MRSDREACVTLKPWQQAYTNGIGDLRQRANEQINRKSNHAEGFSPSQVHRQGAAGEYVVSLYTGLPWTNRFFEGKKMLELNHDVGEDIEVRTRSKFWHDLAMHKNDDPSLRYVLVLSHAAPTYVIAGWMWGWELQHEKRWHPELPYPAWLAHRNELRSVRTLA